MLFALLQSTVVEGNVTDAPAFEGAGAGVGAGVGVGAAVGLGVGAGVGMGVGAGVGACVLPWVCLAAASSRRRP